MGRKRKGINEVKEPLVAFQLPHPLKQRIREEAFKKELSFSAMIREILERYFEER